MLSAHHCMHESHHGVIGRLDPVPHIVNLDFRVLCSNQLSRISFLAQVTCIDTDHKRQILIAPLGTEPGPWRGGFAPPGSSMVSAGSAFTFAGRGRVGGEHRLVEAVTVIYS